ncbi:glycoside hydrolase family 15 protein [Effusibacillus pohliae]|uniref:glycoside hydrolase family 15 protein n=1 Tax=Effusibacillus pohliae TaxID=232270 RepID=UPI0003A50374|nr:glycoside hydrolase family 15 protein [Effusibacillus pohliae]
MAHIQQKPYLIDSIIGNGRILAALTKNGELVRAFWPTIDYAQHVNRFWAGIRVNGSPIAWLSGDRFTHEHGYLPDTNIVRTVARTRDFPVEVETTDYVVPDEDVIVRHYRVTNTGGDTIETDLVCVSDFQMEESPLYQSVLYDEQAQAIAHYRRSCWAMVGGQTAPFGFQVGNVEAHLDERRFEGGAVTLGSDAAQVWTSVIPAGGHAVFTIYIAFGKNRREAGERLARVRQAAHWQLLARTERHAAEFLARGRQVVTGDERLDALYRRSLLVFSLMADAVYGGLIAAPEFDPFYTRCGGYGYCWGRDAGYITVAIDKAGYPDIGRRFYRWAMRAQEADGSWDHRHYMNGDLAPSWGYQADEPASILWGMWQHFRITQDEAFLRECWPSMRRGADHLLATIDPDTGCPRASIDLWEERFGQHTYSSAAVAAALLAAAEAARQLGEAELAEQYGAAGERIRGVVETLYNPEKQSWYRGIRLHISRQEFERRKAAGEPVRMIVDRHGYTRYVADFDPVVDASLLGLSYPFELFDAHHPLVVQTAEAVRRYCTQPEVGGIRRYENDHYAGGNPWVLCTLWSALEANRRGEADKVREALEWVLANQTATGLLPEQVDKEKGGPAWVVPLTWSHAMYVLTILEHYGSL